MSQKSAFLIVLKMWDTHWRKIIMVPIGPCSNSLKCLLALKLGRVELPAIAELMLRLDREHGRGQDTENLVQLKVGGKILASFELLKRDQTNLQLIRNVQHILDQRQWSQWP